MSFTEKPSTAEWINEIIHILDTNQLTFMDLLHQLLHLVFRHGLQTQDDDSKQVFS